MNKKKNAERMFENMSGEEVLKLVNDTTLKMAVATGDVDSKFILMAACNYVAIMTSIIACGNKDLANGICDIACKEIKERLGDLFKHDKKNKQ